jgi:hypothetical protein
MSEKSACRPCGRLDDQLRIDTVAQWCVFQITNDPSVGDLGCSVGSPSQDSVFPEGQCYARRQRRIMHQTKPTSLSSARPFIRLSQRDRSLILAGLDLIVGNYSLWKSGRRRFSSVERVVNPRFDPGEYNQEFMELFPVVRKKLLPLKNYGRLRFGSSFEAAACELAVRFAITSHRHGHKRLDIPRLQPSSKRLLLRLEAVRKRAKRAEIRESSLKRYDENAHRWRKLVKWIRVHIPPCTCTPRRPRPVGRSRTNIDTLLSWTTEELGSRQEPAPDPRELRKFVRLELSYTRRGRRHYSVADLLKDKIFSSARLATLFTIHLERCRGKDHK